jgi:hypothetical protein
MSKKSLVTYDETLPSERGRYHIVEGGNLYLIDFAVDKTDLRPEHKDQIETKVAPFIMRAVRRLGPGSYLLHVVGSASATGTNDNNMTLGLGRAYNAAMHAIREFEKKQKADPTLQGIELDPATESVGDLISTQEAKLLKLPGGQRTEKAQPHFRAAMFRFTAGLKHPQVSVIFHIRELYVFKFKKIEEPLPKVLKDIDDLLDKPIVKFFIDEAISAIIKRYFGSVPFVAIAQHMVSFMIPRNTDYCFEVKDYRDTHTLYRFNGIAHKDSLGLLEVISLVSKVWGAIKALSNAIKHVKDLYKYLEVFVKTADDMTAQIITKVRGVAGDNVADALQMAFKMIKDGTLFNAVSAPGSDWTPFKFHDGGQDHNVAQLEGPARRNSVDAGMFSSVDIEFGGYVPNNWTDYNAEARIISPFSIRNGLFGVGHAQGSFIRLRGPYRGDLPIGPFDVISD